MSRMLSRYFFFLYFYLTCLSFIYADELTFSNGDVLQGSLDEMHQGRILFRHEFLGSIHFLWSDLDFLESNRDLVLYLKDERRLQGRLLKGRLPGNLLLHTGQEHAENIAFHEIQAIYEIGDEIHLRGKKSWDGEVDLGIGQHMGNSEKASFALSAHVEKDLKQEGSLHEKIQSDIKYYYSQSNKKTDSRNASCKLSYRGRLSKKFSFFLSQETSFDEFQDLEMRLEERAGLIYKFMKTSSFSLDFDLALAQVNSYYDNEEDTSYLSVPLGFELRWKIFHNLIFSQSLDHSASLNDFSRYILKSQTKIHLPLNEHWAFNLKHEITKTVPAVDDTYETDQKSSLRLSYIF